MQTFLQLARDAVKEKDYDSATDHLISVFQMDKSNSDAYGLMGDIALSKKDYNTAENYYHRQLELDTQSYEAHKNLGRMYWELTKYEDAISEFKTAMEQDVDHSHGDPYLYLATIYFCLGQYDESYEWLHRMAFEVMTQQPQSDMDFYNRAYYGVTSTINQNLSINNLDDLIQRIEVKYNVTIATHLVVNPDTPVESLEPHIGLFDTVTLMLVYPGYAGAKLVDGILDKVRVMREWLDSKGLQDVMISVDGSVSAERAELMAGMGAQIFVGGTAGIYRKGMELKDTIPAFRQAISK